MKTEYNQITPSSSRKQLEANYFSKLHEFMQTKPAIEEVSCPFCGEPKAVKTFCREGFIFKTCVKCRSLYNSPRLTLEAVMAYHNFIDRDVKCFQLAAAQREARIELLMKPRWRILKDRLCRHGVNFPVARVMEVGPGVGYFTEVIHADKCACVYVEVEMDQQYVPFLEQLKDVEVLNIALESCDDKKYGNNDIIFINSVIEHPPTLGAFFQKLHDCLKPGGFVSLVDMHCDGLDHKVLRGMTPNIYPVNILQVGSVEGIRQISRRNGMEVKDVFSIGSLDTDIIYELSKDVDAGHPLSGLREVLENAEFRSDLQELLKKHILTGYNGYLIQRVD